ncbi:uncharacterized protein ATC70_012185 [Mucor velutinosus]|uniref:Uncharacterized protein n=1 Tax=Mucor velutinosus TaxID=708070 RepID=A0AAN7HXC2_9FUNG|nr:hypothetical protein ATC70_012185 [Mucor velutinosus]
MIETLLEGCTRLQFAVDIHLQENIRSENDMATWKATNVKIGRNSVKSLKVINDCKSNLLGFFVHKYPNMKSILIKAGQTMSSTREDMKRTVTAIKRISACKVKLLVNEDALLPAMKQLFSVDVKFTFKEQNEDEFCIEISSP